MYLVLLVVVRESRKIRLEDLLRNPIQDAHHVHGRQSHVVLNHWLLWPTYVLALVLEHVEDRVHVVLFIEYSLDCRGQLPSNMDLALPHFFVLFEFFEHKVFSPYE